MTTLKAIQANPNVTFSGASDPTQSEVGARVDDLYHQTTSGELFRCTVETLGSQEWAGSQGNTVGVLDPILATDHPNLVAMYTMDNISGSNLVDESPNTNDSTINGAVQAAGKFGNALSLDGIDDYLDSIGWPTPDTYALSVWIYGDTDATGFTQYLICSDHPNNISGSDTRGLFMDNVTDEIRMLAKTSSNGNVIAGSSFPANQWVHVYAHEDADEAAISVNNETLITTAKASGRTGWNGTVFIGRLPTSAIRFFSGLFDQMRVYNRTLTPTERTALYEET